MSELSINARAVCATLFSAGAKATVTFHTPSKIGPECRVALDELLSAGIITEGKLNDISPAIVYKGTPITIKIGHEFMRLTPLADWPNFPIRVGGD